jgi:serine/threonine-protein kinase HipA
MRSALEEQHFAVHLHGRRIATLHRRVDYTWLTFEPSYIEDPDRAVLGLRFEENLLARYAASLRLPPWFSNLLPEGSLRAWIAEARGVPIAREMELLAHVGHDLPGAVQVLESDDASRSPDSEREVVSAKPRPFVDTGWRFSLAGVGLKFSMREKRGQFTAPGLGQGGDWIIKLPDAQHAAVPLNEFAMMTLARAAGIEVPEIRLVDRDEIQDLPDDVWPPNERTAYAIRRFDRAPDRKPIHIEDMAQVRNVYPEAKYQGSFETLAALLYRGRDLASLLEFTRRLAFNLLISNGDAHLKNWSLIYRDGRIPKLAPAYDLVATSVYRPAHSPEDTGLRFCGSKRFEPITPACFSALGKKLGVSASLTDEVSSVVDRVVGAWPEVVEVLRDHPAMSARIESWIQRRSKALR